MSHFKQSKTIYRVNSTVSSGGTLTLVFNSARYQQITGTANHTIVLPDTTTLPKGIAFIISNRSTGTVTVNFNGGSLAKSMAAGSQATFLVFDNSTALGDWDASNEASSGSGGTISTGDKVGAMAGLANSNFNDGSGVAAIMKYNAEEVGADTVISRSSMGVARKWSGGFTINGYGYASGGDTALTSSERYDDTNNYWLSRGTLSSGIDSHTCFDQNGFGYIAGGLVGGSTSQNTMQKYVDSTDTWSNPGATFTQARYAGAGFSLNGYGYLAGGWQIPFASYTNVDMYDDSSNAWRVRTSLNTASGRKTGVPVLNGFGYSVGGSGPANNTSTGPVEKYNDALNTWSSLAVLLRAFYAGTVQNGLMYIMGGEDSVGSPTSAISEYSDASNFWSTKQSLSAARASCFGLSINGFGYACGGGGPVTTVERYSNANLFSSNIKKKSLLTPSAITISAAINDLATQVPVRLRTDGDTWKTLSANSGVVIKLNETVSAKFQPKPMFNVVGGEISGAAATTSQEQYRDTTNAWVSRTAATSLHYAQASFNLDGNGYNIGGPNTPTTGYNGTVDRYNDITDAWTSRTAYPLNIYYARGFAIEDIGYVAGGEPNSNGSAAAITTAYKYDPTLNSWASIAALNTPVEEMGSCTLLDRGYIMGGTTTGNAGTAAIQQYNYILNSWANKTSRTSGRYCQGFALNGFAYVAQGASQGNAVSKYDQQADSWSTTAFTGTDHTFGSANVSNGFAYGHCGNGGFSAALDQWNDAANTSLSKTALSIGRNMPSQGFGPGSYRDYQLQVAIPAYMAGVGSSVWVTRTSKPTAGTNDGGAGSLNGFIYTHGGRSGGTITNVTEQYSDVTTSWVLKANGNNIQSGPSVGILGGFMYFARGNASNAVEKYDDTNSVWTSVASTSTSSSGTAGSVVNGFFYTTGGSSSTTLEQYNQQTNAWATKAAMSIARGNHGAASINSLLYVVNGDTNLAAEQYNDASNSWVTKATPANQHDNVAATNFSGAIYSSGGSTTGVTEAYQDLTNTWVLKSANPAGSAHTGRSSHVTLNGNMYLAGFQTSTNYDGLYELIPSLNSIILGLGLRVTES